MFGANANTAYPAALDTAPAVINVRIDDRCTRAPINGANRLMASNTSAIPSELSERDTCRSRSNETTSVPNDPNARPLAAFCASHAIATIRFPMRRAAAAEATRIASVSANSIFRFRKVADNRAH
jgi:hypothetical protein